MDIKCQIKWNRFVKSDPDLFGCQTFCGVKSCCNRCTLIRPSSSSLTPLTNEAHSSILFLNPQRATCPPSCYRGYLTVLRFRPRGDGCICLGALQAITASKFPLQDRLQDINLWRNFTLQKQGSTYCKD